MCKRPNVCTITFQLPGSRGGSVPAEPCGKASNTWGMGSPIKLSYGGLLSTPSLRSFLTAPPDGRLRPQRALGHFQMLAAAPTCAWPSARPLGLQRTLLRGLLLMRLLLTALLLQ